MAMALVAAPVNGQANGEPPSTIAPLFDASALTAKEQLFGSLTIANVQSEPPLDEPAVQPPIQFEPVFTDAPPSPAPDEPEGGDIIVTARPPAPKSDPLQELNADSFEVIQNVDEAVIAPIAFTYEEALPGPVRSGLSNFISNLGEPIVFLNYLLQLKPGKAIETLGRFTINSTIGLGGLIDVAKRPPFNLPNRRNGFANTLGYYGVEPGPFLFLPLIGPTTVRDLFGRVLDLSLLPFAVGKPFNELVYTVPAGIITSLDSRIELDAQIEELRDADDPYTATRELYLKQRQAEIDALRGKGPDTVVTISAPSDPVRPADTETPTGPN